MKKTAVVVASLFLLLPLLGCTETSTGSDAGRATVRNNSDYVVTCQVTGVYPQRFTLGPGESKSVKAPELPDALKITFPDGTSFTGFIASGDVITITNSGATRR